jgi:phosphatidylserine/phosphatidylglycerophosphate/cardiolipin synthase-like enzyme
MMWLLLATGFTGALTLIHVIRVVSGYFVAPLSIQWHFSPKSGCTEAVVREIKQAHKEILVQAYSFTSKEIAQGLIQAKGRGVDIEIILDKSNEQETYTELGHLLEQGLHPHIDAHHAIAHNKIIIIDRKTLITGSFNFTHQAEAENAENLVVIKGHPELVKAYCQNFATHKAHSQTPNSKIAATSQRKAA